MDAAARVAVLAALTACGGATPRAACAPRVLARGTLGYDAIAAGDAVIAIELSTRFALIVHDLETGAIRRSIDLGPAERDLAALAVAGTTAWVGGTDQAVRTIELTRGAVIATWPIGAAVTALAADDAYVAIGDATGAVCLRRRDGALLQCLVAADAPIAALVLDARGLEVTAAAAVTRYAVPSLASSGPPRRAAPAEAPRVDGVRFGGAIRRVRRGPAGLVVTAWIHDLDDPSVVVVPLGPCAR